MTTGIITNVDLGHVVLGGEEFRDELLVFAAADTFVEGTILARRRVAPTVAASAVTGTGNGTVTAATVVEGKTVPLVGAHVLRCIAAVANGGAFRLEDPNGAIIAPYLLLTPGAGAATIFEVAGLRFTVTDGSTDFALGDTFTLTVAADGKLVPFDPAGAAGAQIPMAVLTYQVSKTAAGNLPIRAMVAGRVNAKRLIIDVDGHGNSITADILDQLRGAGIVATDMRQVAGVDNQ